MLNGTRYRLNRVKTLHLLEDLKANSIETGSLCFPPGCSQTDIEGMLENIPDRANMPEEVAMSVSISPTGAILLWGPHHRYLLMPPFPISERKISNTCEIEPLYTLLHKEFLVALILVRLGSYGVGVFQGEQLISGKVGTGLVHARHRQGGSSSHRFERHRDKQMETFFTRVCLHTREQLEPYTRQLEYVIYGGAPETLRDFRKQCHFTHQFDSRTLDILLNIREPKQSGLQEAIQEAWSSRVIRWDE